MTTDITELAQSLKAAADREMICRDGAETSEIWERTVTLENILALVEALESEKRICATWRKTAEANSEKLEKAQAKADVYDMLRDDYGLREKGVGLADFVDWQANRIAELESRTVKLPDLRQIVSGDRYVWSDGVYNYSQDVKAALFAAGIKVEAE